MHQEFCLVNMKSRDRLEDIVVNGRIVLKWVFKRRGLNV
jgi:hypothetical protein